MEIKTKEELTAKVITGEVEIRVQPSIADRLRSIQRYAVLSAATGVSATVAAAYEDVPRYAIVLAATSLMFCMQLSLQARDVLHDGGSKLETGPQDKKKLENYLGQPPGVVKDARHL